MSAPSRAPCEFRTERRSPVSRCLVHGWIGPRTARRHVYVCPLARGTISAGQRIIDSPQVSGLRSVGRPLALTLRQYEVIADLARGYSRDEVAVRQRIRRTSVNNLATRGYAALGVASLIGAMHMLGWVDVRAPEPVLDARYEEAAP